MREAQSASTFLHGVGRAAKHLAKAISKENIERLTARLAKLTERLNAAIALVSKSGVEGPVREGVDAALSRAKTVLIAAQAFHDTTKAGVK